MNRRCPFCGSDKIKVESKKSNNSLSPFDRAKGCKSKFTGSVRCNSCFSRGPTVSIACLGESISIAERELLSELAYSAWNTRQI